MKKAIHVCVVLAVTACASRTQPEYSINEVLLVNNSSQLLREVTVIVPATRRSFGCGSVAPRGVCGNKIPSRRYEANPIQVEWTFGNRSRSTDEFVIPVPTAFSTGFPLRAVLAVSPDGAIEAYFEQDTPFK